MEKILEVSCNGLTNGGVQHVIMEIVRGLSNEYVFDIIVFNNKKEYFTNEFLSYGGNIFCIPNKDSILKKDVDFYFRGMRIIYNTYKVLKNNGPYKAIHCHNYFESALCLIAAKMAGVKIRIVHSHNDLSNVQYSKIRIIIQKVYQKILNKLATSKVGCSKMANNYLFKNSKDTCVINNSIDVERFKFYEKKDRENYFKLLHVGNFSTQKNQEFLIDIAYQLKRENFNFELNLIGGESEYKSKIIKKIEKLGLASNVKLFSHDQDVYEKMKEADLFLFPSYYEGLGIVLIEAQATGLHCMVSKAIPEEADLGNIEYINCFDVYYWTERIKDYLSNNNKRKKVDMSSYDNKNILKKYIELYK